MKTKIIVLALMMTLALVLCACSADTAIPATPNTGSMADVSDRELEEVICNYAEKTFDTYSYAFQILECSEDHCTVEITAEYEYPTFIETVFAQIELCKDTANAPWRYISNSYDVKYREIDFSPMNGVWNATYTHPSTYLTANNIPYTFTFANAGKIRIEDGVASTTTVNVQHGLDEIWNSHLAPEWASDYPNGFDYESGTMEIRYERSGLYYVITFNELNASKMFGSPAQIRIDERQIIFYDALVARECRLSR